MATSKHLLSLEGMTPQHIYACGSRTDGTARELPVLKGVSLSLLKLKPKSMREPHWHPNANELSYCLKGKALMTLFGPGAEHDTFTIAPGEIVFVPMGTLHYIESIGSDDLEMLISFDHETPEDLEMSSGVSIMPAHVLGATFSLPSSFFPALQKNNERVFITSRTVSTKPELPFIANRYKLDIEAIKPQIQTKGGWVKISNGFLLPTMEHLAVYSLLLEVKGVREPHWHPNAAELNYLISGAARITLLSPDGNVDTFDMKAGDMSFMPRGYLHHIENIGSEVARFAVFFNHAYPSDIGFSGSLGAYSNAVLADVFGVKPESLNGLPKYQQDIFVVAGAG